MLAGGYSWRLFFYVVFAFAMGLLIFAFFVVEETAYKRATPVSSPISTANSAKEVTPEQLEVSSPIIPERKSYISTLNPWSGIDHEAEFWIMIPRSFTYFLVPQVLWVITSFGASTTHAISPFTTQVQSTNMDLGIYIGLGALAFNYTFPLKITAPPYNWSQTNSGLITIATFLGFALAMPFLSSSDRLGAYLTRRNNGIREAEMRLGVILPAMIIAPCGIILYGLAAEHNLPWIAYFFGVGMDQWGALFYFSFTLAYAVDSYNANTSEMLIAMNLGKQAISFGMGIYLLDWILER